MSICLMKESQIVYNNVTLAKSFSQRLMGLMFKDSIDKDGVLYIPKCKSIHTCFMKFSIDALFVNKNFEVVKIVENLKPWRVTPIKLSAAGVFEVTAGDLKKNSIKVGDKISLRESN